MKQTDAPQSSSSPPSPQARPKPDAARAQALRANLQRRKAVDRAKGKPAA